MYASLEDKVAAVAAYLTHLEFEPRPGAGALRLGWIEEAVRGAPHALRLDQTELVLGTDVGEASVKEDEGTMNRRVSRGRTSEELLQDLEDFIPGGVLYRGKPPPEIRTVFARGKGSRIWDVDGSNPIGALLPLPRGHAADPHRESPLTRTGRA